MDVYTGHNPTELPQKVLQTAMRDGLESYLLSASLVVGVSGGPDSLALLHILRALRGPNASETLHVAHLDHRLRGAASEEDARYVAELAEQWGLPYTVRRFDVAQYARKQRLSIEEAARNARYAFLAALSNEQGATITVAHNADDQVETVLMRILRGSGISGLGGMKMLATVPVQTLSGIRDQGSGGRSLTPDPRPLNVALFRPLLGVWRQEIEAYCAQAGLQPRTDATNTDRQYKRNRIRHELIPLLERDYDLAVKTHLYNLSKLAAGEDNLIESLVEEEAQRLIYVEAEGTIRLEQSEIADLPEALRLRLVRWAIRRAAGTLDGFTHRQIAEAARIVSGQADSPRVAHLPHGLTVERLDGWGVISRGRNAEGLEESDAFKWPVMDPNVERRLESGDILQLEAGWKLNSSVVDMASETRKPDDLLMLFDMGEVEKLGIALMLRTRRPGDFIKPIGMTGSKRLQDLFIDAKIPRRVRDRIPLVVCSGPGGPGGEVLWAPGLGGRRSAHAPVEPETRRMLRLEFTRTGEA